MSSRCFFCFLFCFFSRFSQYSTLAKPQHIEFTGSQTGAPKQIGVAQSSFLIMYHLVVICVQPSKYLMILILSFTYNAYG